MTDLARPGTMIGGYTPLGGDGSSTSSTFDPSRVVGKKPKAPSLVEQFGDVLRGLPGGITQLAGKTVQTISAVPHFAYDAVFNREDLQDVHSFGDFTDQYLPLADMVARSMARTAVRLRHPTQYARAIDDGTIVGVLLEDVGNAAIVGGATAKALGATGNAAKGLELSTAAQEGLAAGSMSPAMAARALKVAGKIERGSGLARIADEAGYTRLAGGMERAGTMIGQGAHVLDKVASQPFPALKALSGRAGEMLAPAAEGLVSERLGRGYEIPRQPGRRVLLSDVARTALVGTKLGESPVFSRITPEGAAFHEQVSTPLADAVHEAQAVAAEPGVVIEKAGRKYGIPLDRKSETYQALTRAATLDEVGVMRSQLDRWTETYRQAVERGPEAERTALADIHERLQGVMEGAKDTAQQVTMPVVEVLMKRRLGRLDPGQAAFLDEVGAAMGEMYDANVRMGEQGVGGRSTLPDEQAAAPMEVEVGRRRRKLERGREAMLRQRGSAFREAERAKLQADLTRAVADHLPAPPKISDVFLRGRSVEAAASRLSAARAELVAAKAEAARAFDRYDQAVKSGSAEVDVRAAEARAAIGRVTELTGREQVQARKVRSLSKVKQAEPVEAPAAPAPAPAKPRAKVERRPSKATKLSKVREDAGAAAPTPAPAKPKASRARHAAVAEAIKAVVDDPHTPLKPTLRKALSRFPHPDNVPREWKRYTPAERAKMNLANLKEYAKARDVMVAEVDGELWTTDSYSAIPLADVPGIAGKVDGPGLWVPAQRGAKFVEGEWTKFDNLSPKMLVQLVDRVRSEMKRGGAAREMRVIGRQVADVVGEPAVVLEAVDGSFRKVMQADKIGVIDKPGAVLWTTPDKLVPVLAVVDGKPVGLAMPRSTGSFDVGVNYPSVAGNLYNDVRSGLPRSARGNPGAKVDALLEALRAEDTPVPVEPAAPPAAAVKPRPAIKLAAQRGAVPTETAVPKAKPKLAEAAPAPATPKAVPEGLQVGAEKAKVAELRGRRLEAQRVAAAAEVKLGRVAGKVVRLDARPPRLSKAIAKVSKALEEVQRVERTADAVDGLSSLTAEEKAAAGKWQRAYTRDGRLRQRAYVENLNRVVGAKEEKARAAMGRLARIEDRIAKADREIADLPASLARSAQSQVRDVIHGRAETLPLPRQGEFGPVKAGDWVEAADGKWGRVVEAAERPVRDAAGKVVRDSNGDITTEFDGWRLEMAGGGEQVVRPGEGWRWVADQRGHVGTLRRQLRKLRDPFGEVAVKVEQLDLDPETKADMRASGLPTQYEVPAGRGVVWERVQRAVRDKFDTSRPDVGTAGGVPVLSDAEYKLMEVADGLRGLSTDRERLGWLAEHADDLGLDEADLVAFDESVHVDEHLASFDVTVADAHRAGYWMDLPMRLRAMTEDLDFAHAEWQNRRNRVGHAFEAQRARLLADDALNVQAMPSPWRTTAQIARREVKVLLARADELSSAGDHLAAREQLVQAAEIATSIRDLADAGVDPRYVVGGVPSKMPRVGIDPFRKTPLAADQRRHTPFFPVSVEGAQATQLTEMVRRVRNQHYDLAESRFGRTPSQIPELRSWLVDYIGREGEYPTADKFIEAAAASGWTPLRTKEGLRSVKVIDRVAQAEEMVRQAGKDYETAIAAGDGARIQRARFRLDQAEQVAARAKAVTPRDLRAAWGEYDRARGEYEHHAAVGSSADKIAEAWQAMQDAQAVLAAAEEAVLPKLVPDTIAREMRRDASLWDRDTLPGFRLLARTNRAYKTQVLPLSARWYLNNTLGNVIMAGVFGGVDPVTLVRNIGEVRGVLEAHGIGPKSQAALEEGLLGGRFDVGQVKAARIAQSGLFETQRRGLGLAEFDTPPARTKAGRVLRTVTDAGYGVNEFFDNVNRSAVYLAKFDDYLRKAARNNLDLSTPAAVEGVAASALRDTLRAMGDYTNMAPWQRKYLRQVFPFWSWIRHSTVAAMRLPVEHPMRAAWLAQLSVVANDEGLTGDELSFFAGRWNLGDGRSVNLGTLSPLEDQTANPLFYPPSLLKSAAPALKIATVALTGVDLGRMQQVSTPGSHRKTGFFGQAVENPLMFNPADLLGYTIGQVPVLRALRDIVEGPSVRYGTGQQLTGKSGQPIPSGKSTLGVALGVLGIPTVEEPRAASKVKLSG